MYGDRDKWWLILSGQDKERSPFSLSIADDQIIEMKSDRDGFFLVAVDMIPITLTSIFALVSSQSNYICGVEGYSFHSDVRKLILSSLFRSLFFQFSLSLWNSIHISAWITRYSWKRLKRTLKIIEKILCNIYESVLLIAQHVPRHSTLRKWYIFSVQLLSRVCEWRIQIICWMSKWFIPYLDKFSFHQWE